MKKFISWRRVSTKRQGRSGLGLQAQLDIVKAWAEEEQGEIVADYVDVYTGTDLSGCVALNKAIAHCKQIGAILIIAKTDRFRNDAEAISIYNKMNGSIYFCDCPSQDEFMIKLMFLLAAREARQISIRTKQGLNVIKEKHHRGEIHISKAGLPCTHLGRPKGCPANANANRASAESKRNAAMINPHNVAFYRYITLYERNHGTIYRNTDLSGLVNELNTLQMKTATGMDFNENRARAMLYKVRKMFAM